MSCFGFVIELRQKGEFMANILTELPMILFEHFSVQAFRHHSIRLRITSIIIPALRKMVIALENGKLDDAAYQLSLFGYAFTEAGGQAFIDEMSHSGNLSSAIKAGIEKVGVNNMRIYAQNIINAYEIDFQRNNRSLMGVILNDTDCYILVDGWYRSFDEYTGAIYMAHGRMTDFMRAYNNQKKQDDLQLISKPYIDSSLGKVCYGGFYVMIKRDYAAYGVECTMRLRLMDKPNSEKGIVYFQFLSACPYSQSNRVGLCISGDIPSKHHDDLYKKELPEDECDSEGYTAHARVESGNATFASCLLSKK